MMKSKQRKNGENFLKVKKLINFQKQTGNNC